jgi:hypothetical protein
MTAAGAQNLRAVCYSYAKEMRQLWKARQAIAHSASVG